MNWSLSWVTAFCLFMSLCIGFSCSSADQTNASQRFVDPEIKAALDQLDHISKLYDKDESGYASAMGHLQTHSAWFEHSDFLHAYASNYYNYFYRKDQRQKILTFFDGFLENYENHLTDNHLAKILSYKVSLHLQLYDNEVAEKWLQKAILLNKDPEFKATLQYQMGSLLHNQGQYFEAIQSYLACLPIIEKQKNGNLYSAVLSDLSLAYSALEQNDKALEFAMQALQQAEILGNPKEIGIQYINTGGKYESLQEDSLALQYYLKGLSFFLEDGNEYQVARTSLNIGNIYMKLGKYKQADSLFAISSALSESLELEYGLMLNNLNRGLNALYMKAYDESKTYFYKALSRLRGKSHLAEKKILFENLYQLYEEIEKYDSAYYYLDKTIEIEKILFDVEKTSLTENMEAFYQNEKKEGQLQIKKKKIEAEKQKSFFLRWLLVVVSMLVLLFLFFVRWRSKLLTVLYQKNIEDLQLEEKPHDAYTLLFNNLEALLKESLYFTDPTLKLSTLADLLDTNPNYLSGAIKQETGKNFNAYINEYRIQKAIQYFKDPECSLTLEAIMEQCGFQNRGTFFSAFKKITGMSPGQYRKKAP